ncbi:MAG: hypothetical protein ABIK43_02190 [candidate division WOR-3 bacterium]
MCQLQCGNARPVVAGYQMAAAMPNPLEPIRVVFDTLGSSIKVLPAIGGVAEDLVRPEQEETDDALIHRQINKVTEFAETPEPDLQHIYRPTPPLFRPENHYFRYFIDGSFRTYFLGTGVETGRSFPIMLAQIGAAVIRREDDGRLHVLAHENRLLLLVPAKGEGLSDTVWQRLRDINLPSNFRLVDYLQPDPLTEGHKDSRDKANGKVRAETHQLEVDLIATTDGHRNNSKWLILDGATKISEFIQAPYLIGVAKAFSKQPEFQFGGQKRKQDISMLLAGLPHCCRTVAFKAYDGQVAFWYVRMREQNQVGYPLMGVVKVELPCPDKKPVSSELADLISLALVAERSVCPYGVDKRWHCCIYPIYMAEQVIKTGFYSKEVLLGAVKWPTTQGGFRA